MSLKPVRCTICGIQMSIAKGDKLSYCESCNNTFVVESAEKLYKNSTFDQNELLNLRFNLNKAISDNNLDEILKYTKEILVIIPDDMRVLYYYSYAANREMTLNILQRFQEENDYGSTLEDRQEIAIHITYSIDLRDKETIREFIIENYPDSIENFDELINQRIVNTKLKRKENIKNAIGLYITYSVMGTIGVIYVGLIVFGVIKLFSIF